MNSNSDTLHKNNIPNDIPRQRWLRIIPPILIACIISYMDRVNIAFAMPGGMDADLGITASMAGLAGGIFFIGYLFLQVPGGKIAVHGSGKKFIGWSLVAWVVISILTGLVTNHYQLLFLRFALGVAEGGMLPVVLTMISNWFPDAERGRANAIVIMFVPIAGIITAPLSGWIITALDWRWLFIIEGLMSVAVLVGCGVFLQSAAGVFWTIPAKLFSAEMAGGARGVINSLGNLGGFCGPYAVGLLITYYNKDAGVYCLALSLAIAALLALLLPAKCDVPTQSGAQLPEGKCTAA